MGKGFTLLFKLSMMGRTEVEGVVHDNILKTFTFLLERRDVDVNISHLGAVLAIHHVVDMRDPAFLHLLLEKRPEASLGINALSRPNGEGEAPLHCACRDPMVPLENIRMLLAHGADPNMKCGESLMTPLQYLMVAYAGRDVDRINKLIAIINEFFKNPQTRLGDPTLVDKYGRTLLHYAARNVRSEEVCDMLLRRGEYKSIKIGCSKGVTPLQEAMRQNNTGAFDAMVGFRRVLGG